MKFHGFTSSPLYIAPSSTTPFRSSMRHWCIARPVRSRSVVHLDAPFSSRQHHAHQCCCRYYFRQDPSLVRRLLRHSRLDSRILDRPRRSGRCPTHHPRHQSPILPPHRNRLRSHRLRRHISSRPPLRASCPTAPNQIACYLDQAATPNMQVFDSHTTGKC